MVGKYLKRVKHYLWQRELNALLQKYGLEERRLNMTWLVENRDTDFVKEFDAICVRYGLEIPGDYIDLLLRDPEVIAAVKEMMRH